MKYLYQQLLAFIGVIALIILIVGTSFTQLTKRTMQENNYEQLYGYAESALETRDFLLMSQAFQIEMFYPIHFS